MSRSSSATAIATTLGVVAIAGTAAYMMNNNKDMRKRTKKLRKSTCNALNQVGHFVDNMSAMMR